MTVRFPGLVIADWQTRLVHDHPRLFPDTRLVHTGDGPALSASGWPAVPDGWRAIVETACRRLDAILAAEPDAELFIHDVKEKYGGLRLAVTEIGLSETASAAMEQAVDLAEAHSFHVCEICGGPGQLSQHRGWYATRCETHADAFVPVPGPREE